MKTQLIALGLFLIGTTCSAQVLNGFISNERGMIGIRTDWDRKIDRVYLDSPAERAGLRKGDYIQAVDDVEGAEIIGEPYTEIRLRVFRYLRPKDDLSSLIFHVYVERLPESIIRKRHRDYLTNH